MIPAGTWDFSMVECHKFNTTSPTQSCIIKWDSFKSISFVDFNLILIDPPNLISYTTYGTYYFINTSIIVQNSAVETLLVVHDAC